MSHDDALARAFTHVITRALQPLEHTVADIAASLSKLRAAIAALPERILGKTTELRAQITQLQSALADERAAADTLAQAEDAEDVEQNAALADARAETDRVSGTLEDAAGEIDAAATELGTIAAPEPDESDGGSNGAEEGQPVDPTTPQDPTTPEDPAAPAEPTDPAPVDGEVVEAEVAEPTEGEQPTT